MPCSRSPPPRYPPGAGGLSRLGSMRGWARVALGASRHSNPAVVFHNENNPQIQQIKAWVFYRRRVEIEFAATLHVSDFASTFNLISKPRGARGWLQLSRLPTPAFKFCRKNFVLDKFRGVSKKTVRKILVGIPSDGICQPKFILGESFPSSGVNCAGLK